MHIVSGHIPDTKCRDYPRLPKSYKKKNKKPFHSTGTVRWVPRDILREPITTGSCVRWNLVRSGRHRKIRVLKGLSGQFWRRPPVRAARAPALAKAQARVARAIRAIMMRAMNARTLRRLPVLCSEPANPAHHPFLKAYPCPPPLLASPATPPGPCPALPPPPPLPPP